MADVLPILPADYLALIPNPDAGVCDEMQKVLFQLPQADYTIQAWMSNEDGTITTEFATAICNALSLIDCSAGGTTTTGGTGSTTSSTTTVPATALAWAVTDSNVTFGPGWLLRINLANGSITPIGTANLSVYVGLAEDPSQVGSPLYGLVVNGTDLDLITVDKVTAAETVVVASVLTGAYSPTCMRFSSTGTLYWADNIGRLFTMDPVTGAIALIGTAAAGKYVVDMAFKSGVLYGVGYVSSAPGYLQLFTVNTANGALTNVGSGTNLLGSTRSKLTTANSILYSPDAGTISQVNSSTGTFTPVSTWNFATYGQMYGLANGM